MDLVSEAWSRMSQIDQVRSLLEALDSADDSSRRMLSDELWEVFFPPGAPHHKMTPWDESVRRSAEHFSLLRETGLLIMSSLLLRNGRRSFCRGLRL